MFPRDRVRASLTKYNIPFEESAKRISLKTAETLRERTLSLYSQAAEYAAGPPAVDLQLCPAGRPGRRRERTAPIVSRPSQLDARQ